MVGGEKLKMGFMGHITSNQLKNEDSKKTVELCQSSLAVSGRKDGDRSCLLQKRGRQGQGLSAACGAWQETSLVDDEVYVPTFQV